MKFFIDTANIEEIKKARDMGVLDGVTTNPSLVSKEKRNFRDLITEICSIVDGPVSAEVVSTDVKGILSEARDLAKIASNIVVKVPLIADGLRAAKVLSEEGIKTNVTLCLLAYTGPARSQGRGCVCEPVCGQAGRHQPKRHGAGGTDSCNLHKLRV